MKISIHFIPIFKLTLFFIPINPKLTCLLLIIKNIRDDDQQTPQSPQVFRRMQSREDTATDVFSRLGAGIQEPPGGGQIREYSGKVRNSNFNDNFSYLK